MKRKILPGIIGGFIGFAAGALVGGYIGLVLGGTFLGSLNIHENTGFEGYELAAYAGAIIGAIALAVLGVILALRITDKRKTNSVREQKEKGID